MATNQIPIDGLASGAKKVGFTIPLNTPAVGDYLIALAFPSDWTLNKLYVTSNDASVDVDFTLKVDGANAAGYTAVTYDDNSSVGTVTADLDIDADETLSINITSATSPGYMVFTGIGTAR